MLDPKNDTCWILVAEDDEEIRHVLRETLRAGADGLRLEIIEAKDGIDALAKVNSREFQCVLTDIRMPRSSGLELIRAMQLTPLNAHTPKLVVTAASSDELESLATHIRIVKKPFIPAEVARMVVREIRLGRMDDRAAVHLINPFTQAIDDLLRREMKLEPQQAPPTAHKFGDNLEGDIHCSLVIAAGQLRHRFTLSFDKTLLQGLKFNYFQPRSQSSASLNPENIAKQLCQLFHERAAAKLEAILGTPPVLSGNSICTKDQAAYGPLRQTSGIKVAIKTIHGSVIAGAHSKTRPRRV